MYKKVIRPLLFKFNPESIHGFSSGFLKFLFQLPFVKTFFYAGFQVHHKSLEREVFGLRFKNPVGLAAGFDKDAKLVNEMAFLGFGFTEIGTLTPKAQTGNARPRLFRLPEDRALINRMGFNNHGVEKARKRLARRYAGIIVGGNIGKNKDTPNDKAVDDYLFSLNCLYDYVDYFVVNVSSPNTPGLRALQDKEPLQNLMTILKAEISKKPVAKPILLKIAPDLTDAQLDDIIDIIRDTKTDGVIATNTTISRENLKSTESTINELGNGGLSGAPLKERATAVIRYLHQKSGGAFPIIGVGGIMCANDAIEKIEAGATLVQIYSGFIYEGPALVKQINKKLIVR